MPKLDAQITLQTSHHYVQRKHNDCAKTNARQGKEMKEAYEAGQSQGQGSRGQSQESERGVSPVSPVLTVTGFDGGPRPILFTARTWNSYTVKGVKPRERER